MDSPAPLRVRTPPASRPMQAVERELMRDVGRAVADFDLIADGDRIMVAVSGGKDSYSLLLLLEALRRRAPVDFSLVAVHLDQGQPGHDTGPLESWLRDNEFEYRLVRENTYAVVKEKIPEGSTYCSLCARLRRGILYRMADEVGATKIALGHHRDDAVETLLLNLFFAGKLASVPAHLVSDDGAHVVIRPLIYCAEPTLARYAQCAGVPILPCNLCGSQPDLQRKQMKIMLDRMEAEHPNLRQIMLAALGNVNPSHLLDRDLVSWEPATGSLRPSAPTRPATTPLASLGLAKTLPRRSAPSKARRSPRD